MLSLLYNSSIQTRCESVVTGSVSGDKAKSCVLNGTHLREYTNILAGQMGINKSASNNSNVCGGVILCNSPSECVRKSGVCQ